MTSTEEFQKLLNSPEGTRVEFKAASGSFSFEELVKYCVALANEGGGTIVPRAIRARTPMSRLRLHFRVGTQEALHVHHSSGDDERAPARPARLCGSLVAGLGAY